MNVTVVGRPNVGKSALFNRIAGKRIAIVDECAGITRDRIEQQAEWENKKFKLVDTGGYIPKDKETIISKVKEQAKKAIQDSSLLLFVIDVQEGITPLDLEVAEVLRKSGKRILVVGNKADNPTLRMAGNDLYSLGFPEVYVVSALHGMGVDDLLDAIVSYQDDIELEEEQSVPFLHLAIVGRPNVGKSTFINAVLHEERVIVDDLPGTTRDSIDVHARIFDRDWLMIDTAGIRKKKKIREAVEKYSLIRTQESIKRADIVIFMLDSIEEMAKQDEQAISFAKEHGKSCVVVVNKWDCMKSVSQKEYEHNLRVSYDVLAHLPVKFISALKGENVDKLLKYVLRLDKERNMELKTTELNELLKQAFEDHAPPIRKKKRVKLYYATQIGTAPPKILCFVNNPIHLDRGYENYLLNMLRKAFRFEGTPVKLVWKGKRP